MASFFEKQQSAVGAVKRFEKNVREFLTPDARQAVREMLDADDAQGREAAIKVKRTRATPPEGIQSEGQQ